MNNIQSLVIIKSFLINFPIIKDFCGFNKILTLVTVPGQMAKLVATLRIGKRDTVISTPYNQEQLRKALSKRNSVTFLICPTISDKKTLFDTLYAAMSSGFFEETDINALPVVVTEESFFPDSSRHHFVVSIDDLIPDIDIERSDILPSDDAVIVALDKCSDYKNSFCLENTALRVINRFLFEIHNSDVVFRMHEQTVDEMLILDEEFHDCSNSGILFRSVFRKWLEKAEDYSVCELPYVDKATERDAGKTLFFTDAFIYMRDDLLKSIIVLANLTVPVNAFKRGLLDDGVLSCDCCSSNTYTVKMHFCRETGQDASMRMLRFNRDAVTETGSLDVIDYIDLIKGDYSNED